MDRIRLLNNTNYKNRTNNLKVTNKRLFLLYKKTKNLYRDENLENFGLGKENPEYRCDVLGATNVTEDYYLNTYLLIPVGTIFPYAGISEPNGYLLCNGSAVGRMNYTRLFNVISTLYGTGDGTTTFNLPDLRGRVPIGSGNGGGLTSRNMGVIGGSETHTLSVSEMPSHNHTGTTNNGGDHNHTIDNQIQKNFTNTPGSLDDESDEINCVDLIQRTTNNAGVHNHTFTTDNSGGGNSHNIMQPFIVINYIIRY